MKQADRPHRLTVFVILTILTLTTATLAQNGQTSRVTNAGVAERMATMNSANAALTVLSDMMGGKVIFSRKRADAAQEYLIKATEKIPSAFRKQHVDPLSNARPIIWSQWDDFKNRAKDARRKARALDTDSLPDLRKTLPRMILACLNCHQTYRQPVQ